MKKFTFKLKPLEDLRKRKEDESLKRLAEAQRKLQAENEEKSRLLSKIESSSLRFNTYATPQSNVQGFQLEDMFIIGLKQKVELQDKIILRTQREVEKSFSYFLSCRRETRKMEVLREHELTNHKNNKKKWDLKEADDLMIMRSRLQEVIEE